MFSSILLADDEAEVRHVARKEQGSLSGRVSAAHGDDRLTAAQPRLDLRGGVMDTRSLEPREIGERQPAVAHAGGDHDRVANDRLVVAKLDAKRAVSGSSATASPGTVMCAPNFRAWMVARSASSSPEIPAGKPR